ncbi:hypothetical protein GCM10007886_12510 [Methylobacterium gregans]|uniref:SGNH hydrolase-type esterase domain-containing protein n=1 Tax=Methylobacterium gregans TaxID=374424 RepID=A0AA37MCE4_9HYPH|nr:SGNH family hydrolase [Methylobacterium gregans]MDQ0519293.1 hypothetical protein [Methylobacterium gregans]GJD79788.1 hypothetical protein NBEOAGPD_3018 [Methylobacterium gregans]GLS53068.1 hypothetical protein GCM10007886_12510 [Methylobacterium gregans]
MTRSRPRRTGRTLSALFLALFLAGASLPLGGTPAHAQWGDSYDAPDYAPRRRPRDAYYTRDDAYRPPPRRYAPPQEAPRQFYWPWEDRPQPQAQPPAAAEPTYRRPRPRPVEGPRSADGTRPPVKRQTRPAPAAPPKPAIAKTEPNIQIAVFGDSLADHLSRGLDDVFEDNADVAVNDRAKGDSGLVRRDVVDWPKVAEDYLKTNPKVAYAVVMLGANDRQAIREGEESFEPLSERWREIYRARAAALVGVFRARKLPLIWVSAPPVRSESLSRDLAAINDILREVVQREGGIWVDVWPGFVDDRNRYTVSGPDLEGQTAKLRTSDGVHFTHAGARKLAHFVDVELKRLMGSAAPTPEAPAAVSATPGPALDGAPAKLDDVAALDRQITAMLPSLPEPPGIPALPVKPAAGPVMPLGRAEISPGGALISGRPQDGDPSGNVDRALQRGAAPLPQPGRADDFRWPPG